MANPLTRRALELTPDYSARTPLWLKGANLADLAPLDLPPGLAEELIRWQRHFDAHFGFDRWPHWDTDDAKSWFGDEGHRLHERLARALPDIDITLSLWPLDEDGPEA